jgi:hypothetical protein
VFEIEVFGASGVMGTVGNAAPLPEGDASEIPLEFIACT